MIIEIEDQRQRRRERGRWLDTRSVVKINGSSFILEEDPIGRRVDLKQPQATSFDYYCAKKRYKTLVDETTRRGGTKRDIFLAKDLSGIQLGCDSFVAGEKHNFCLCLEIYG